MIWNAIVPPTVAMNSAAHCFQIVTLEEWGPHGTKSGSQNAPTFIPCS